MKSQDPPVEHLQTIVNLFTDGKLQQALNDSNELLEKFPNSIVLCNITGAANAGLIKFDAAIESYKKALKINPDYADAYYNMAIVLNDKGESELALEGYRQALKIKPNYADAYINMGVILKEMGDLEAAIKSYKQALKIKPNYAEAYNNMGIALKDKGDLEAAIDSYNQAVKINPNYAEAYNNIGNSHKDKGDPESAINSYKKALKITPNSSEVYNNMGIALKDKGDLEAAIDSYKKALKITPNYAEVLNNMGVALEGQGIQEMAFDCFKKALKIQPHYSEAHYNMGNNLKDKGNQKMAIDSFKKAIKIKPDFAEAYRQLSKLKQYKKHDVDLIKMQKLYLDIDSKDEQRCHLNFALSKAYEDLNEINESFNYLKKGNDLRKKILSYNIKQDVEFFSQIKKSYPSIAIHSVVEESRLKPIFILGMPRSGTTLVEQVISSHSKVTGGGELPDIGRLGSNIARGRIKPSTEIILEFRRLYIEVLRKKSNTKSIVTDKMPHNFRYNGLIFSAFPAAKIIHVNRDPAAVCWSNYKNYFATKGLGYCYDLDDIVKYFGLYKDLMQFWKSHYGDSIYSLNYDNLTVNQADETRRLIEYIELDWEDKCLSPEQNKRTIRTVSQEQVRQKVYQGSSQQWRKFEPYLNGIFDQF